MRSASCAIEEEAGLEGARPLEVFEQPPMVAETKSPHRGVWGVSPRISIAGHGEADP
jgi:hypothetical protein